MGIEEKLSALILPIVEGFGYELWGVEYLGIQNDPRLVVYIDSEKGIRVEDCEKVSRQVSALFDVEEPIQSAYRLEVSSPGADRKLFELNQYEKMKGHWVRLELDQVYEGRRKWKGQIIGLEDGREVVIQVDEEQYVFPFECIVKARIIPQF